MRPTVIFAVTLTILGTLAYAQPVNELARGLRILIAQRLQIAAVPAVQVTIDAPASLEVTEGNTLQLTAAVTGNVGEPDFFWYRDQGAKSPQSLSQFQDATLEIEHMTALEEGAFWVAASVDGDIFTSNVVQVHVVKPLPLLGIFGTLLVVFALTGLATARLCKHPLFIRT